MRKNGQETMQWANGIEQMLSYRVSFGLGVSLGQMIRCLKSRESSAHHEYVEIKQSQTLFGIITTFLLSYKTNDINDKYRSTD